MLDVLVVNCCKYFNGILVAFPMILLLSIVVGLMYNYKGGAENLLLLML